MSNISTEGNVGRRRRANRARILEAALAMIASGGFASLTLHGVAAATDYTRAALYRYFDSKEALIGALTVEVIREIAARIGQRIAGDAPPLVKVIAAVAEYQRFAADHPEKFGMISMLMAEARPLLPSEDAARPALLALEETLALLATLLEAATARGDIVPGDNLCRAAVIFSSAHGALQLRKQAGRLSSLAATETLCSIATVSLLIGWGATPEGLEK